MSFAITRHVGTAAKVIDAGQTPRFLASVRNCDEADLALRAGAQIIDVKDPSRGALGAATESDIREIVARVAQCTASQTPVSATIGDLPLEAAQLVNACTTQAATGVDIVKVGLITGSARLDCIEELGTVAAKHPMMAVLFADLEGDQARALEAVLEALTEAQFLGVMIDTFDKRAGSLATHWPVSLCRRFVDIAHQNRLLCGLAGSLTLGDIESLAVVGADVLGFRGALCSGVRTDALDMRHVRTVRDALKRAHR